ncbi:pollen-specific leucine-rich repeat extensin-like protein 4 [Iris pallida]|uniref:Pollen-specific leucine-rich repeat extensin-like protein 4 n=1 Tax=Iris pallida TaxID=29817 RepID=A0AAX6IDE3_IRIPA|nr:pollen-specific leucine-rich repeat extensin-like protein 4 [Iris pallida]
MRTTEGFPYQYNLLLPTKPKTSPIRTQPTTCYHGLLEASGLDDVRTPHLPDDRLPPACLDSQHPNHRRSTTPWRARSQASTITINTHIQYQNSVPCPDPCVRVHPSYSISHYIYIKTSIVSDPPDKPSHHTGGNTTAEREENPLT